MRFVTAGNTDDNGRDVDEEISPAVHRRVGSDVPHGLIIVCARAPAIRQFVTLILCSKQELFELRFINTAFRAEPASEVRLFFAEYRSACPQFPNDVARQLGLPQHRGRSTGRCRDCGDGFFRRGGRCRAR